MSSFSSSSAATFLLLEAAHFGEELRAEELAERRHLAAAVTARGDFSGGGGFAEASEVFVSARALIAAPRVEGDDDFLEVGVGQLAVDAAY
ncbi:MAG: hypothetical protein ABIP49_04235 [Lysobacterales bacterium]